MTALCSAGSSVYSASADKTVVCWDAVSRAPLHVQCDHSSYVKALLLCNWQLWSLSKDSLHVTAADGVFNGLHEHLELSQSECGAMSSAVASLKSQIEELHLQIQASYRQPINLFQADISRPLHLHVQDMNLVRSSVEQQLKDKANMEAALASETLAAAEARISSLIRQSDAARESSERELSTLHSKLLQQEQQTLLAEAAAVDARAAQAVEKLTDERNSLQKQQEMLQELHEQLQLQHNQQVQLLQVERDKILEQSLEISRLQAELSNAREASAKLLVAQVATPA